MRNKRERERGTIYTFVFLEENFFEFSEFSFFYFVLFKQLIVDTDVKSRTFAQIVLHLFNELEGKDVLLSKEHLETNERFVSLRSPLEVCRCSIDTCPIDGRIVCSHVATE